MKNGDKSAMPLPNDAAGIPYAYIDGVPENKNHACGLTKREHFAGLAMQGICANHAFKDVDDERMARWSVSMADDLLKALEDE